MTICMCGENVNLSTRYMAFFLIKKNERFWKANYICYITKKPKKPKNPKNQNHDHEKSKTILVYGSTEGYAWSMPRYTWLSRFNWAKIRIPMGEGFG